MGRLSSGMSQVRGHLVRYFIAYTEELQSETLKDILRTSSLAPSALASSFSKIRGGEAVNMVTKEVSLPRLLWISTSRPHLIRF